jgi:SdpI/YfhL protein family
MDPVAITISVGWIAAGLLKIGLAIPLLQGKVRRNALYGVRFRQSFQSDEAWFVINRYGAKRMIIWALPMIVLGVATIAFPLQRYPGRFHFQLQHVKDRKMRRVATQLDGRS